MGLRSRACLDTVDYPLDLAARRNVARISLVEGSDDQCGFWVLRFGDFPFFLKIVLKK